jgi:hypothetical protein
MPDKPSYIGLLNAISVAESEAECYLDAWAAVTPHDGVRSVLTTIALREGEHGKAFAKRLCELGYGVIGREADRSKMDIACSTTLSDKEKFEKLGLGRPQRGRAADDDIFLNMFRDTTVDIQTGALLGRYVAEERDSGRMFEACYAELCRSANGAHAPSPSAAAMASLEDRLCRVEALLEKVCEAVSARN